MEFLVTYGEVVANPMMRGEYGRVNFKTMVVEAEGRIGAFLTAYDHLVRGGRRVRFTGRMAPYKELFDEQQWLVLTGELGFPSEIGWAFASEGDLSISKIEPYPQLKQLGRVLSEARL